MKERLLEFLRAENKSSAQFAEEIGVQPSGISHIISGRNNPSLDFILKMLEKYQFLSTDWLLFGKGSMYKESKMRTLFDQDVLITGNVDSDFIQKEPLKPDLAINKNIKDLSENETTDNKPDNRSSISRIIWFYDNNSFEEYFPRK
jgi:transcriptional regulator with XRE-family HTH domain